jgi:hypothetical protein
MESGDMNPSKMFSKIMRKSKMFKTDKVRYEIFLLYKYKETSG